MIDFLNSNLFQTLATLLAGLVAYLIYLKQKRDSKRDAANSILLEIQHAERSVARVREAVRKNTLDVEFEVMQADSWSRYKHLFSRDFDKDEWDAITDYYIKSHLLDEAIHYNNKGFAADVDQIRMNRQKALAEFTKDLIDQFATTDEASRPALIQTFKQKIEVFDQVYMEHQGQYSYNPTKPVNDAKKYLEDLNPLSTSSVGQKLKKLAGIKN